VLSIIEAAGWPIWFIIVTSIIALAIIGERFWSLRTSVVAPRDVLPATIREYQAKGVTQDLVNRLQAGPLIGRIFAAALVNEKSPREVIKDAVEDAGRAVGLDLYPDTFAAAIWSGRDPLSARVARQGPPARPKRSARGPQVAPPARTCSSLKPAPPALRAPSARALTAGSLESHRAGQIGKSYLTNVFLKPLVSGEQKPPHRCHQAGRPTR